MATSPQWVDAAQVCGVMDPWLQRDTIAEDIVAWVLDYQGRVIARSAPHDQPLLMITLNGLLDELNAQMFLAESKAKDTEVLPCTPEHHCDEAHCCEEER